MRLTKVLMLGIALAPLFGLPDSRAQDAPVPAIPKTLPQTVRDELDGARAPLLARIDAYSQKVDAFESACGHVPTAATAQIASCRQKLQAMDAEAAALENDKKRFAAQLNAARDLLLK